MRDVHGYFDEEDEHGEDGDDDVVVCDADTSYISFYAGFWESWGTGLRVWV